MKKIGGEIIGGLLMGRKMALAIRIGVGCATSLVLLCCTLPVFGADTKEVTKITWDLELLSAVVPKYTVEKVPASKALDKLFVAVLGGTDVDYAWLVDYRDDSGKKVSIDNSLITLDLANAPVVTIIGYISELSGCHWKISGWPGVPFLQLTRIVGIDDTGLFLHTVGIACSHKAARALGITEGMLPAQVGAALSRYGVSFEGDQMAMWNAKAEMMAVRNLPQSNEFVRTLINLSENDWQLSKKESPKIK